VYGTGAGVVPTCLFAMPSVILGRGHDTARAFGIVMTGRNMGVLIGPVLVAQAFKISGSWDLAAPIFGTVTTLCLVAAMLLARRLRR
jgi:F0F1-type ATP synthase assembly protein I